MSMNFGDIPITTVELPEGGIGTFSPSYFNMGLTYGREFSNSIYGGFTFKVLSQSISNARAGGVSFDAGIRYITGETDQIKFGITLKNVGPPMQFSGDGLTFSVTDPNRGDEISLNQRSAQFELPSLVDIGASYDFKFNENHMLTAALAFTSNSFTRDQVRLGLDYSFDVGKASFNAQGWICL